MDGLDQPSTAGAAAALPGGGGTIRQPAPRRRGRAATSWGESVLRRMKLQSCSQVCGAHPRVRCVRRTLVCYATATSLWRLLSPRLATTWF